jgi:hypothetical protein
MLHNLTQYLQVGVKAAVDLGRERHFFFCTYRNNIWYSALQVVSSTD